MALNDQGYNYNKLEINTYAPAKAGIYGLFRGASWIYFGEAINIRDRLIQHTDRDRIDQPCIALAAPTGFCFAEVAGGKEARVAAQDAWILACQGTHQLCNQKLG
jgi:hypothetical protein